MLVTGCNEFHLRMILHELVDDIQHVLVIQVQLIEDDHIEAKLRKMLCSGYSAGVPAESLQV